MRKLNIKMLLLFLAGYVLGNVYINFFLDVNTVPLFNSKEDVFKTFSTLYLIWFLHYQVKPKKFMPGEEKGTARFGTKDDIKPIIDENEDNNVLFTQTEQMSLNTRKTRKNLNQLIIGGSGAGKTRFFIKPNLMQKNTSFVITDPKGEIFRSCGKMLEKSGYNIKVFNLIDMEKSSYYNPFEYVKKDEDVLKLITNLVKNTNPEVATGGDPFFDKAETALLQAIMFLIIEEGDTYEKNFPTVMQLLQTAEVKEDNENHVSELDLLFEKLEKRKPDHIAVKQYKIFKMAAGKTAKSILISVGVRLAPFSIENLARLVSKDTMELESIGIEKTALFIIIPDSDSTFNFLAAMMYTQLFNVLFYVADFENGGRLPIHVRFMLDEFANIGSIPDFEKLIATMRSREMSVSIVLQNLAQIKSKYKESWESITGNCDSFLFLGGNEWETLKYVSEMLGKQTIDVRTSGKTRGSQGSSSLNYQVDARELMMPDELKLLPDSDCILFIRGIRPFKSKKINLEKHKNFKELEDFDKSNAYDIAEYKNKERKKIREKVRNSGVLIKRDPDEIAKNLLVKVFEEFENQLKSNEAFEKFKIKLLTDINNGSIRNKEEFNKIIRELQSQIEANKNKAEEDEESKNREIKEIENDSEEKRLSQKNSSSENSLRKEVNEDEISISILYDWMSNAEKLLKDNILFLEMKEEIISNLNKEVNITKEEFKNIMYNINALLINHENNLDIEEELEDVI